MNNNELPRFSLLSDFNNEFQNKLDNFTSTWNSRKVEKLENSDLRKEVFDDLFKKYSPNFESASLSEMIRFISIIFKAKEITKLDFQQNTTLEKAFQALKIAISQLDKRNVNASLEVIQKLEKIDNQLYFESLAHWINKQQIGILDLYISNNLILKIAPYLTYLDFNGFAGQDNQIAEILEKCTNLTDLRFSYNPNFTGKALDKLIYPEKIKTLKFYDCQKFNHPLPDQLLNLQTLDFAMCHSFNQRLSDNLDNLKSLSLHQCSLFNQKLPIKLINLEKLSLTYCLNFNEELPEKLNNLKNLTLEFCPNFNRKLPGILEKLEELSIIACSKFDPFTKPLEVILLLLDYQTNNIIEKFKNLSLELQLEFKEKIRINKKDVLQILKNNPKATYIFADLLQWNEVDFIEQFPELKTHYSISKIEKELESSGNFSNIGSILQKICDYYLDLDSLKVILMFYPHLTKLLIENNINKLVSKKNPEEKYIEILPFLSPDQIQQTFKRISKEELDIENEQFKGTTEEALNKFHDSIIKQKRLWDRNQIKLLLKNLLKNVSEKNFASYTIKNQEIIVDFLDYLDIRYKTVVFPILDAKIISRYLSSTNILARIEGIKYITSELKQVEMRSLFNDFPDQVYDLANALNIQTNEFNQLYSEYKELYLLGEINDLYKNGETKENIETMLFNLINDQNYLIYLKNIVRYFPVLVNILLVRNRETIFKDIQTLQMNLENLPQEMKIELLPLFSPDKIWEIYQTVLAKHAKEWLSQSISFQTFHGTIENVLVQIYETNLSPSVIENEERRINLLKTFSELFSSIPYKTLAAFAITYPEIVFDFSYAFEERQMTTIVPVINKKVFVNLLKNLPIENQLRFLMYANKYQKKESISRDLAKFILWDKWCEVQKPQILEKLKEFEKHPTFESFQNIETNFNVIKSANMATLTQYELFLKSLKKTLLKFSDEELSLEIDNYLNMKLERIKIFKKEHEDIKNSITQFSIQFKSEEIPDEFIDLITGYPMINPYQDKNNNTLDISTWATFLGKNPFNRENFTLSDLKENAALKERIDEYRKSHLETLEKASKRTKLI